MDKVQELLKFLDTKPAFGKNELLAKLNPIFREFGNASPDLPSAKMREVDEVKKYDVLYLNTIGLPHYFLVHKVTDTEARGIILSSKQQAHNLCLLEEDRFFKGGYATKTYLTYDLDHCKKAFCRTYESKKEANKVFRTLREFYKDSLAL